MTRFLHTADWQLGMTRHFLRGEAQARFAQARIEAVRTLARLADAQDCAFVVVAGDVLESNLIKSRTVGRTLDALRAFNVPTYLLPGNHDALDASTLLGSDRFREGLPDHVQVLLDETPQSPCPGVEVVGAPWRSRRPLSDLTADACDRLAPAPPGTLRVVVGHGTELNPNRADPAALDVSRLAAAIEDGRAHYVALGDCHSSQTVAGQTRIRYSGAPEPTSFREPRPGRALVVALGPDSCHVEEHVVGTWSFADVEQELKGRDDVERLVRRLDGLEDKPRTVVRLSLRGSLSVTDDAHRQSALDTLRPAFAALFERQRNRELVVRPGDGDFEALGLAGFAKDARDELAARLSADPSDRTAADALALLQRLATRTT